MDADDRLRWLLETGLLHDTHSRHEAFLLLENAFAAASDETKRAIWDEGMAAYPERLTDDQPREPTFAVWINRIDPEFGPAQEVLAAFAQDNPGWEPSEHPEFTSYVGDVRPLPRRQLPEELVVHPTFEGLREIELSDRSPFGSTLPEAVAAVVNGNPDAGVQILEEIAEEGAWDSSLWHGVRYGLERAFVTEEMWPRLLTVATRHEDPRRGLGLLSRVLLGAINREPPTIGASQFGPASKAIHKLLAKLRESGLDTDEPGDDIMFAALNTWPGQISEYLIASAAHQETEGDDPCSAPGLREFLLAVTETTQTNWARVALAVLARDFPYLWERCPELVRETTLRTFNWSDPVVAAAAWEGIAYARWSHQTVEALSGFLPELVSNLPELSDNAQRGLISTLANIATSNSEATAASEWLDPFIARNSDDTRADFALALRRHLETMRSEDREAIWTRWLRGWWERRGSGFPVPIGPREGSMMLAWTLPLSNVIHEVLPLALDLQLSPHTWDYLHAMRDSDLLATNPTETATLVGHVLRQREQVPDRDVVVEILERASNEGASEESMLAACNAIAALGENPPGFCTTS